MSKFSDFNEHNWHPLFGPLHFKICRYNNMIKDLLPYRFFSFSVFFRIKTFSSSNNCWQENMREIKHEYYLQRMILLIRDLFSNNGHKTVLKWPHLRCHKKIPEHHPMQCRHHLPIVELMFYGSPKLKRLGKTCNNIARLKTLLTKRTQTPISHLLKHCDDPNKQNIWKIFYGLVRLK